MATADIFYRALDAVNGHDAEAYAALYAPNALVHDPAYPQPLEGRVALRDDLARFIRAFPDLHATTRTLLVDGDVFAGDVTFVATHAGPLELATGEIPPTGRRVEFGVGSFFRVDGQGRIVDGRRYYDVAGLVAQLGVEITA